MADMLIYGGCVTRDTYEGIKADHKLLAYVSRQSLISASSRPTKLLVAVPPTDGFESRNFNGDISSSLYGVLERFAATADLFVFDLVVERLGVLRLPDNTFVTRSAALAKSGQLERLSTGPRSYRFGTEGHFRTWEVAARKFIAHLTQTGLLRKTLLIETPWAKTKDNGEELPRFRNMDPLEANDIYERYYAVMRDLGVSSVRLPLEMAVSTDTHRWGAAPYHYVPAAYDWMRDRLLERVEPIVIQGPRGA
jgi:hypothetical protein